MLVAETILLIVLIYTCCGLAIGVPLVLWGVRQVDAAAQGTSLVFRLLLLPGTVAFWPLMLKKWLDVLRHKETAHDPQAS